MEKRRLGRQWTRRGMCHGILGISFDRQGLKRVQVGSSGILRAELAQRVLEERCEQGERVRMQTCQQFDGVARQGRRA